jgi:NAD(P)-dependent dehydrogenase (short-subunit alcohol dehydrogenase family)
MRINDSVVILTGGAGGIGRPAVEELLARGAKVCAVDINREGLQTLAEDRGSAEGNLHVCAADVSIQSQVEAMVAEARGKWGQVNAIVNNAGLLRGVGPLWEVDPDRWWRDVKVNLYGTFLCTRAVLPGMMENGQGVIINLTGGGLSGPNPAGSGYGCSKVALARLTDTLAAELVDYPGIRVFAVAPGFVRSGITEFLADDPSAQPWFGYCREWLEKGKDNSAEGVARLLADIIERSTDLPNGRVFLYDDDIDEVIRNREEIDAHDIRQVRFLRDVGEIRPSAPGSGRG